MNLNDKTPNNNTLTPIGTPTESTVLPFASSNRISASVSGSAAFSAVDSTLLRPSAFTAEMWIKTSTTGAYQGLFQSWAYTTGPVRAGIQFIIYNTNVLYAILGINSGVNFADVWGTTNVCDNAWHHVAVTWEKPSLKLYVDGVQNGTTTTYNNDIAYQTPNYVRIGCNNNTGSDVLFFTGLFDEVRFWNYAKTEAQVNANKSLLLTGKESGLLAYWTFDSGDSFPGGMI